MAEVYEVQQSVRVWGFFKVAGVLTDPTTIQLQTEDPSGNEDSYTFAAATVTKDGTGIYYRDVLLDEASNTTRDWTFRWKGTGAVIAAWEESIEVQATVFVTP